MANWGLPQVTAFYDDSGVFTPQGGCVTLGMVVIPSRYIKECNISWWEMVWRQFPSVSMPALLPALGIEAKVSDLQDMANRLEKGYSLKNPQVVLRQNGLNSPERIQSLIQNIYQFVAEPRVPVKFLAICADKHEYLQTFYPEKYPEWQSLVGAKDCTGSAKRLGQEMATSLLRNMYHFLLQRLNLLQGDGDFEFSDAFVVGDETSSYRVLLAKQSVVQAGLDKHGDLPFIINKSWFGSSTYEPCLQIADSIAYSVLTWAEKRGDSYLRAILPNFRGYPDNIMGRGLRCCPDENCFPNLN